MAAAQLVRRVIYIARRHAVLPNHQNCPIGLFRQQLRIRKKAHRRGVDYHKIEITENPQYSLKSRRCY